VAIAPAAFKDFERWKDTRWRKRGDDYDAEKARLTDRLRAVVLEQLPQLRGRIDHEELSTPLSTLHFSGHAGGAMYGLEHTPDRFQQRWLRAYLPIRDLFVAGQDVVTVGVGAALMSAVLTSSAILRRNVLGDVLR
jgi:all-trans-retinol 13,14-reductase